MIARRPYWVEVCGEDVEEDVEQQEEGAQIRKVVLSLMPKLGRC